MTEPGQLCEDYLERKNTTLKTDFDLAELLAPFYHHGCLILVDNYLGLDFNKPSQYPILLRQLSQAVNGKENDTQFQISQLRWVTKRKIIDSFRNKSEDFTTFGHCEFRDSGNILCYPELNITTYAPHVRRSRCQVIVAVHPPSYLLRIITYRQSVQDLLPGVEYYLHEVYRPLYYPHIFHGMALNEFKLRIYYPPSSIPIVHLTLFEETNSWNSNLWSIHHWILSAVMEYLPSLFGIHESHPVIHNVFIYAIQNIGNTSLEFEIHTAFHELEFKSISLENLHSYEKLLAFAFPRQGELIRVHIESSLGSFEDHGAKLNRLIKGFRNHCGNFDRMEISRISNSKEDVMTLMQAEMWLSVFINYSYSYSDTFCNNGKKFVV